jgi:hypothetical protein
VPDFTSSLDAKVPGENIIYVDRIAETGEWFCVSEAHDGAMFTARGKTEPTSRRAAGLRTLAHLKGLADGELKHATPQEIEAARLELARILTEATIAVGGYNGEFPASRSRDVVIFQLLAAKEVVESKADNGMIARYVGPLACFLAGGFANGLLGKLGERSLELLEKLLAN